MYLSLQVALSVVVSERCWPCHDVRRRLTLSTWLVLHPVLYTKPTLQANDWARDNITGNDPESVDHVIAGNISTTTRVCGRHLVQTSPK